MRRQRIDLAVHRHLQHVGAEADQRVIGREQLVHLSLIARELAEEQRMLGREVGTADHGLLVDRRAQDVGEARGLLEGVAGDDLVPGQDHRLLGGQQPLGEPAQRRIGRAARGIDAGRRTELDRAEGVQDVAGQRDEHRPGRRRRGDLGGAVHDARQVGEPRHLGRPLDHRCCDRHQRRIEQRLGKAVALLLLARGHDDRRAGDMRRVQRADRIAEARRNMDVTGRELARGAGIAVCHREHDRFLQAKHVAHLGGIRERVHDRQLGGAGIAEDLRDAFGLQQLDEGRAATDLVGLHPVGHERCRPHEGKELQSRGCPRRRFDAATWGWNAKEAARGGDGCRGGRARSSPSLSARTRAARRRIPGSQ